MNYVNVIDSPSKNVPISTLRIGQFAILHANNYLGDGMYNGETVLRTQAGLVNLSHPERSIALDNYSSYEVEVIPAESRLEIHVGDATYTPLDQLTTEQRDEIMLIRDQQSKITAVKYVRELTSAGLLDAKTFVENL